MSIPNAAQPAIPHHSHSDRPATQIIKAELIGEQAEQDQTPGNATSGEQPAGSCCDDEQTAEAKLQEMMNQKPEGATGTQKQGEPAQQGDIPENIKTIGPLTPWQRAKYMSHQMIEGVKQWFSANWPALLAGVIGFLALNVISGGAAMAAIPPLLQIIGTVMTGVSLAGIAGHLGNYLTQGWAGEIPGAAKSLARGLAAGAIELVFALVLNARAIIKALKGGVKGTTKAIVNSVKNTVKTTLKSIKDLGKIARTGAKTALKNGKIMLQGVKGGFAKSAKSLDDLLRQLTKKLHFNKFKIRRRGLRIQLLGHINPWIVLADGSFVEVDHSQIPAGTNLDDELITSLGKGKFVGDDIPNLLKGIPGNTLTKGKNFKDHFINHKKLLEDILNKRYPKFKTHADEFLKDLSDMISSGRMKYTGISTLKKGSDPQGYFILNNCWRV